MQVPPPPRRLSRNVLVANRGEIAVRIFRALRELGIGSVAVYSEADRAALHVRIADEAYLIGPGPAAESYSMATARRTALRAGAEAIHRATASSPRTPVSRAPSLTRASFDRPAAGGDRADGVKTAARAARWQAAGVPIVPGTTEPVESAEELVRAGRRDRLPAVDQGGRRRRRQGDAARRRAADGAERAFESARREGETYFADAAVYVEQYIDDPRHVEMQVLADAHGNVIHLGERDCTIQRRHQKLVEETPVAGCRRRAARADRRRSPSTRRAPSATVGRDDRGAAHREGNYSSWK